MDPIERVTCLKVPLDIVPPEQFSSAIHTLLAKETGSHIVLLSLWDLLKARKNNEYRSYVLNADLVIPISKSILGGCRFLTGKTPYRYMPFDFTVRLLHTLEARNHSVYLLGASRRSLQTAERNLRQTFPGLRIVGRCAGGFKRQDEDIILKAINKASPSLLLVSTRLSGDERWIARNEKKLTPGVRMWCSDLFDVFAERKSRPGRAVFDKGLEWFGYCIKKPLYFFRIFPYFRYKLLLLFYKIFKRR